MNTAEKLMEQNRVEVEINGLPFVLRRVNANVLLAALGSRAFNLIETIQSQAAGDADAGEQLEVIKQVLQIAMVAPRLGPEAEPSADVVTWLDVGDYATALFTAAMQEKEQEEAANFPESSEGLTD